MKPIFVAAAFFIGSISMPLSAQGLTELSGSDSSQPVSTDDSVDSGSAISLTEPANMDKAIAARLREIYRELDGLEPAQVVVDSGLSRYRVRLPSLTISTGLGRSRCVSTGS